MIHSAARLLFAAVVWSAVAGAKAETLPTCDFGTANRGTATVAQSDLGYIVEAKRHPYMNDAPPVDLRRPPKQKRERNHPAA